MLSWEHSGFSVHAADEITAEDENARLFLARYLKKCPLSLERLRIDDTGLEPIVCYRTDDGGEQSFSPLEFLARLSQHIPRVFEQTVRYMGVYSSRSRGAKRAEERFQTMLLRSEALPPEVRPSTSWARAIKRVYEVDPLLCGVPPANDLKRLPFGGGAVLCRSAYKSAFQAPASRDYRRSASAICAI
ncbi:MAG: transposase [Bdellovibrionales bacterium]|nr:transposase [Bdellovibrionales bacterium]